MQVLAGTGRKMWSETRDMEMALQVDLRIRRRASAFNGNVFADLGQREEERPMEVESRRGRLLTAS